MKMIKQLSFVLLTGVVASFSTACSWWENGDEEEISQFYQPDDGMARAGNTKNVPGAQDPDAIDLTGVEGKEKDGKKDVDAWGKDVKPADDSADSKTAAAKDAFGDRIANVNFEPAYFLHDKEEVRMSEEHKLKAVVDYLKNNAKTGIVVEGHCSTRGAADYNRSLGEKRAIAVKQALVNLGADEARIKTVSYGEERPAVQGETEDAHARNRRAEFIPVAYGK